MTIKKTLFVGCSLTATSGFTVENQSKYHWPHLVCRHTGHHMVNQAIGGMSNREIFLRTVELISADSYDLVIVVWSEIGRLWAYHADKNVDDFTILNHGITKGFGSASDYVKQYAKLHYTYFDNKYVSIKEWLLYCIALETFFKKYNTPYIFVKGFDNYINAFSQVTYDNGFVNANDVKPLLDFENRSDDYILKKITTIHKLIAVQDQAHWLNLKDRSVKDMTVDYADDNSHPGIITNLELSNNIINFYKNYNE